MQRVCSGFCQMLSFLSGQLLLAIKDSSIFFSITKIKGVGVLLLLGSCLLVSM